MNPIALPAFSRRGSILIVALWVITILSIFCISVGYHVRQKISLSERLDQREMLYGIAEAGIQKALVELAKPDTSETYDSLGEPWAKLGRNWGDIGAKLGWKSAQNRWG